MQLWEYAGLDCAGVYVNSKDSSGKAWLYTQQNGKTICFGYGGAAETTIPDNIGSLREWAVICPVLNQFTLPLLEKAICNKSKLVVTGICSIELLPYLKKLRVLIVNQYEAENLIGHLGINNIAGLSDFLKPVLVYVTYGSKGSKLFQNGEVHNIPVIREGKLCDVTGAGDAFTAGVVYGLMQGYEPVEAGYIGSCCSSYVIEKKGGQNGQADLKMVRHRLSRCAPEIAKKIRVVAGNDSVNE